MHAEEIPRLVEQLAERLTQRAWSMVAAESCTGGWLAKSCTDLAGSSAWFERGFVTYSYASKVELLGVDQMTLQQQGAVSEAVARQMAEGALLAAHAQAAVAITGIAGPDGGMPGKPVGTVWFAWAIQPPGGSMAVKCEAMLFAGNRSAVRRQSVVHALAGMLHVL